MSKRIELLKEYVLSEQISSNLQDELFKNTGKNDFFTVFLSVCDKKERARVFHGSGKSLNIAWGNTEKRLSDYKKKILKQKKILKPIWVKADIVTHYEKIQVSDLVKIVVKNRWHNFSRIGLAFDGQFKNAFIEAEVNANKMIRYHYSQHDINKGNIDYEDILINLGNINHYLKSYYGVPPISDIPDEITIFTARGFFCDENSVIRELYNDNMNYGRRRVDLVDNRVINEAIISASEYLINLIEEDGKFVYGYFPIFGEKMTNYNIVRHTSTLWSVINLYRINKDEKLMPKIDKAVDYIDKYIEYYDDNTAYLVEKELNEIKLGANGVAIIMYTEYMNVFQTDKYTDIVRKLANGILKLQDSQSGRYYHILNFPGFTKKEEFRTVYYDGEATFALARAYSLIKDKKYIDGARAAVENFIKQDYTKYCDHWVAYSLLEITKHIDDKRYYEFALKNIDKNLKIIYDRATSFHTYLEMLMAGWQTYQRAVKADIKSDYIKGFNPERFAQTIYYRAGHMLNGYFYPEYAMYMKYPGTIVNSFCVRHHNFRVRIDDIQHFIGGYYFYSVYYEEIRKYLSDDFIKSIDRSSSIFHSEKIKPENDVSHSNSP